MEIKDKIIKSISISIGSFSEDAKRITSIESLLIGKHIEKCNFEKIDFKVMNELSPITDIRSDKKYRKHATEVLISQIVKDCIMKAKKAKNEYSRF